LGGTASSAKNVADAAVFPAFGCRGTRNMMTISRWYCIGWAGISLALATSAGCQTNVAGMTLPSGHYMQHPPQYFAPSPGFPLQRELAAQEAQDAGAAGPGGAAPVAPGPVVPPPPPGAMAPPPQ